MADMFQGDYIWIEPVSGREFDVAIGARVISAEGRRIQVKDDDGKVSNEYDNKAFQRRV
jgi:myosin-7